jgi:hypothetical protein
VIDGLDECSVEGCELPAAVAKRIPKRCVAAVRQYPLVAAIRQRVQSLPGLLAWTVGTTSTPNDTAAPWIAPNWPIPDVTVGSRRTAARVTPGASSFSS